MSDPTNPQRRPISADNVIMHPSSKIIALKCMSFLFNLPPLQHSFSWQDPADLQHRVEVESEGASECRGGGLLEVGQREDYCPGQ